MRVRTCVYFCLCVRVCLRVHLYVCMRVRACVCVCFILAICSCPFIPSVILISFCPVSGQDGRSSGGPSAPADCVGLLVLEYASNLPHKPTCGQPSPLSKLTIGQERVWVYDGRGSPRSNQYNRIPARVRDNDDDAKLAYVGVRTLVWRVY